jgi:hypothetical protein
MKRLFALLLLVTLPLFPQSYNEHILKIEANIIPRIILMDYKFDEKLIDGKITIAVIYNPIDIPSAKKITKFFREKYPDGIKGYPITVLLVPYDTIEKEASKSTLYYLMDSDITSVTRAVEQSRKHQILVFSHDSQNLKHGAHVSLKIDKKIVPFLNPTSLKASGITLRPALLSISELYQ